MNTALLLIVLGFFGSRSGTTTMPLLRIGQGPRAAALGESYVSVADDASALYWNPAGLGQLNLHQFALSHHQWFSTTTDEVLQGAVSGAKGALGLSLVYSAEQGIEAWDENNTYLGDFSTWNVVAAAGYGFQLLPGYHLGAAVKGFYNDLYQARGYGGGADIGALGRPLTDLAVGIAARNIGVANYDAGLEPLPTEVAAGASYRYDRLRATFDVVLPLDNNPNLRAGVEYWPVDRLALRLGYRTGPADLTTLGFLSGLTTGLGVRLGAFGLDYSLTPYGKLGIAHRIGISTSVARLGSGTLRLKVVDAETMGPLAADLAFSGVRQQTARAGLRTGEYSLTRLVAGELVVRATLVGYQPRIDTILVLGDREQSRTIALSPLRYGSVWGRIYDATTDELIGGAIGYSGPARGRQPVPAATGSFALNGLPTGSYTVTASGPSDDYLPQTCTLEVQPGRVTERDFRLVRKRQTIILEGINFATGKADIRPEFEPQLRRAGRILIDNPRLAVELAGHTDAREINTAEFPSNWELSQARAEAVRDYLVSKFGIASDRLIARGYADTQPLAPNTTDANMARNRRTEFRILDQ